MVFTLRLHPTPGRYDPRGALRPAAVCTLRRPAATTTSFDAPRLALATLWSRRLDHGTQKEMRVIIVIVSVVTIIVVVAVVVVLVVLVVVIVVVVIIIVAATRAL